MNALGLIVEYNPFHNGHLYHLNESLKQSGAEVAITVMSGHFTQRGEPTIIDKWTRTKLALQNGADLIIELPYVYSCQHADLFAKGAVSILTHLQANKLIFGSESGDISKLKHLDTVTQTPKFQEILRQHLKLGLSLPQAQVHALTEFNLTPEFTAAPNNTLGLYYLKAIRELNSPLIPNTLTRIHSDYRDLTPTHHQISSATSIRILRENQDPYASYVPENVHQSLSQHYEQVQTYHNWEAYYPFLKQKILTLAPKNLYAIHDMEEGLEHRFYEAALKSQSFAEFMERVKTKRYTRTRIQRICSHVLTHTTKDLIKELDLGKGVPYIRILGFSTTGKQYLKSIKKAVTIPIYSKFEANGHLMFKHEQRVTAAYSSILPEPHCTHLNLAEFTQFPIQIQQIRGKKIDPIDYIKEDIT